MTVLRLAILLSALSALAAPLAAQETSAVSLTVEIRRDTQPIADVTVRSGSIGGITNAEGRAVLRLLPGEHQLITAKIGFKAETLTVALRAGTDTTVRITVIAQPVELSGIIVSATRSGRRIEDVDVMNVRRAFGRRAYNLNVAGYLLKPVTFSNYCEVMAALNKYWTLVEMP